MSTYRKWMSKGECLFSALLWTVTTVLYLILFFLAVRENYLLCGALLLAMQLGACAFHWYRYLTYNKAKP